MALKIDSQRPLRSYAQLKALVEAVRDSDDPGAEHHAIEWKGSLDLDKAAGAYAIARTLLGYANRGVSAAKRHFEGLAYLIVGVELGRVEGMPRWDGEKLGPAIERYVGADGPTWQHDNITVDGLNVIVFTVEAPKPGDHIHTLRRAYPGDDGKEAAREGEVFVRRGARTERSNSAELKELERRLLAANLSHEISVDLEPSVPSPSFAFSIRVDQAEVESWVQPLADELLAPLEVEQGVASSSFLGVSGFTRLSQAESRTPQQFRAEVADYLEELRSFVPEKLRSTLAEVAFKRPLRFRLTNPSLEALESVLVKVTTPIWLEQHFDVRSSQPRQLNGGASTFSAQCAHPTCPA